MKSIDITRIAGAGMRYGAPLLGFALLAACVAPPVRTVAVAPPPPPPKVFVYPANGQSPEQLERDRYECHVWAVQQTGVEQHFHQPARGQPARGPCSAVRPAPSSGRAPMPTPRRRRSRLKARSASVRHPTWRVPSPIDGRSAPAWKAAAIRSVDPMSRPCE